MTDRRYHIDKSRLRRAFDAAARAYDEAAVLQHEVRARLLERLDYIKLEPSRVLDAGTGTGRASDALLKRYRSAQVVALDLAYGMVQIARRKGRWLRRPLGVNADIEALPFADGSFDLVFSNLTLQWLDEPDRVFAELRRVLAPHGLLMFTTFGPDTLRELRTAWQAADAGAHVNEFLDMHDVGDALVRAGFADPVMDMEMITVTYERARQLMRDLKAIGAANAMRERQRGLTGRARLQAVEAAYEAFRTPEGLLPATYEVVYGHAWAPDAPPPTRPKGRPLEIPVKVYRPGGED
jgi:malonyl-CoA O-methyltransferase